MVAEDGAIYCFPSDVSSDVIILGRGGGMLVEDVFKEGPSTT